MTQSASVQFTLSASGYGVVLPNSVYQATGNLTVSYTINGSPASMTITVEGLVSPATSASSGTDFGAQPGSPVLLDTYNSTSSTSNRSIAVSGLFDSYRITATFAGGNNVTVNGSLQTSGPGASFNSASLNAVQTYAQN